LQFYTHDDGRIRVVYPQGAIPGRFEWDYFVKDHLGNVRMVLTEEAKQDIYPAATLENTTYNGGTAISIEDDYYNIDASKIVTKPGAVSTYQNNNGNPPYNSVNPYSNTSANNDKMYKLNATANTVANKTGLGIALKVMAGDTIGIFGKSFHQMPGGSGYTSSTNSLSVQNLIDAFAGTSLVTGKATGSQITGQSGFPSTIAGLLNSPPAQSSNTPKAFINWIILDEQFKYVSGGFDQVGAAANTNGTLKTHDLSTIPWINIQKNGYIYVYCSNESQYDVFFDNLQVVHNRGRILEETHYYPFGLTMAGISSKALTFGEPGNKYKFNKGSELQNKEFSDGSGLELYATNLRSLDPQVGRWWQIDSKPDYGQSLYSAMYNNPISNNDPFGDTTRPANWSVNLAANSVANTLMGLWYGLNGSQYQLEPSRGATVAGIRDTHARKGKGLAVVRVDKPHGKLKTPHLNVEPYFTGVKDPHTPLTNTQFSLLKTTGQTLETMNKIALPFAIAADGVQLGLAIDKDAKNGTVNNSMLAVGKISGSWSGAVVGAELGAHFGVKLGTPWGVPGQAIGGLAGGFLGGIGGAMVGNAVGGYIPEMAKNGQTINPNFETLIQ
jgi:RHS repeat-associated protein